MWGKILEVWSVVYELGTRYLNVVNSHGELEQTLEDLINQAKDIDNQARREENLRRRRTNMVKTHLNKVLKYQRIARTVLQKSNEERWMPMRMWYLSEIELYQEQGQRLFTRGRELWEQGLTTEEVILRGYEFPVGYQYVGETARQVQDSALQAIRNRTAQSIGIYGSSGAGKTSLMKNIHNEILADERNFKAVYWAASPNSEPDGNYIQALQKSVADGMYIQLDDNEQEERTAAQISRSLRQNVANGRAVLFLDDVKKDFRAYEVLGIPCDEAAPNLVNCILVFTTRSLNVCNRMKCDLPLKMDLLGEEEAVELFLHELQTVEPLSPEIQDVAVEVAKQCARMPLAIIIIARSMAGIRDLPEWRNRFNELSGTIQNIHEDVEDKIMQELKFGYTCLKDRTVKRCFLAAARMLNDDSARFSKQDIIENWKELELIGSNQLSATTVDQGHAILNQLERVCLLQVALLDGNYNETVTMNKWIRKMAAMVTQTTGDF